MRDVNARNVPSDLYGGAKTSWDDAVELGEEFGYRNAQATVLAPTGTIGFMMDCDTTGVEPDIALVKYKKLVGGGLMKIVNQTVPMALKKLGYTPPQIDAIVEYIDENETIEGAPGLKDSHLPVFDSRTPVRQKLPDERKAITHKFDIAGHEGYITVGLFENGQPGEIFLVMAKEGSTISGFADAFAQAISYALQYGVPLQALVDKFSHVRFEPSGMTRNPEIRFAKSIVDYIFRWLASKFLSPEAQFHAGVNRRELDDAHANTLTATAGAAAPPAPANPHSTIQNQEDAPPCSTCGAIMIRSGACYKCVNCGTTSGCA